MQMTAARLLKADMCLLYRETLWRTGRGCLAWSGRRYWENSMLARRDRVPEFPPLRRGEDSAVVRAMVSDLRLALLDEPQLYVHVEHRRNTWKADHWDLLWESATMPAFGRQASRWLEALGRVVPVAGTLAAVGEPAEKDER
jgi:hypothetical protein